MRRLVVCVSVVVLAAVPSTAAASVDGPHETLDNQFTTTQPGTGSGWSFTGAYHAAGDPNGAPPYMRSMVFFLPDGLRYDTSVPDACTASDLELAARGAAACPSGSRLGGGTSTTAFFGSPPSGTAVDVFNAPDQQIILARSPVLTTVSRGVIRPDNSVAWASPTCFPSVPGQACPVDDVLQYGSAVSVAPYARDGRNYLTTPPTCPASGHWQTPVTLTFADGSVDQVTTEQPCAA